MSGRLNVMLVQPWGSLFLATRVRGSRSSKDRLSCCRRARDWAQPLASSGVVRSRGIRTAVGNADPQLAAGGCCHRRQCCHKRFEPRLREPAARGHDLPNGAAPNGAALVETGAFAPKGEPPKGALPPKGGAFAPGKFLAAGKLFDMANYTPPAKFTPN